MIETFEVCFLESFALRIKHLVLYLKKNKADNKNSKLQYCILTLWIIWMKVICKNLIFKTINSSDSIPSTTSITASPSKVGNNRLTEMWTAMAPPILEKKKINKRFWIKFYFVIMYSIRTFKRFHLSVIVKY